MAMLLLCGCGTPPASISIRTTADLEHAFTPATSASAQVMIWRYMDSSSSDSAPGKRIGGLISTTQLTLEERNFLAGVQRGVQRAGFHVAMQPPTGESAYVIIASLETVTGMYDTYRRVPVFESTSGHVYTRDGYEPYHATTSSEYIVPERRPFVHRIVTLSAIAVGADSAPGTALTPNSPAVVWRGRLASDADVIDADLAQHVATLLEGWGISAQREVKHKRQR